MSDADKLLLGQAVAERIENNHVIGVGTGTTVSAALVALQKRIEKDKLDVQVVPTSYQTAWQCTEMGFTVLPFDYSGKIDIGFDGADEVDDRLRVIKGRGGAHRQEKCVAHLCNYYIIIATREKFSENLGTISPVPVEFDPAKKDSVAEGLRELGGEEPELRIAEFLGRSGPCFTDTGNLIFDVRFATISDTLEKEINALDGVVENGIFTDHANAIFIAENNEVKIISDK